MTTTTAPPASGTMLIVKRRIAAARPKVFEAWTRPEMLKHWFAPTDDYDNPSIDVDLRPGGKYRIVMRNASKNVQHVVVGEYREVKPPERLVFTWEWEGEAGGETLVTVDLREMGEETEVVLKHELFQTVESRDNHKQGWEGCLNRLEKTL